MSNADAIVRTIADVRGATGAKDLQIYLHIPFCSAKCHFCDWVDDISVTQLRSGRDVRARYVGALCRQIEFWGPQLTALGYRPRCIYWGGGTPTRLDPDDFGRVQDALRANFDLRVLSQHTMESTPSDLTSEKLAAIEAIGVTRLSFGVQSFEERQLRTAGRSHTAEQAADAIVMTQRSSIRDVNIDLISGFPDESPAAFKRTLDRTVALAPTHISVYSYRATPRTIMAMQLTRGVRSALAVNEMVESYELAQSVLTGAGYDEYCFNYFTCDERYHFEAGLYGYRLEGDIIGFGAGADSTLAGMSLGNTDTALHRFIDAPLEFDRVEPFTLERPEMLFPLFGGALMTRDGLSFERFEYLTGIPFAEAYDTPEVKAWFRYVQNCGAQLAFEADRIHCADRQIHRVYLRNLAYTLNPALAAR
jgi:oxygen-independent coproporphyrinogen-3 oxidase